MTKYKNEDLPTGADTLSQIVKIKGSTEKDVNDIRDWLVEKNTILHELVHEFIEKVEYKEDPDIIMERLYLYQHAAGGLYGLAESLYERSYSIAYKALTEESRSASATNKQKLTAGDREIYAKSECSDLKGLRTQIETTAESLKTRMFSYKNSNKRW